MAVTRAKVPAARTKRRAGSAAAAPSRAHKGVSSTPSVAAQLPQVRGAGVAAARRKFEAGIIARNEAVPAGTPLPPGATHEIVGKRPDGTPILKRKRFSAV